MGNGQRPLSYKKLNQGYKKEPAVQHEPAVLHLSYQQGLEGVAHSLLVRRGIKLPGPTRMISRSDNMEWATA